MVPRTLKRPLPLPQCASLLNVHRRRRKAQLTRGGGGYKKRVGGMLRLLKVKRYDPYYIVTIIVYVI